MSEQIVCDGCGEPIDTSEDYFTVAVTKAAPDAPSVGAPQRLDYHVEHMPPEMAVAAPSGGD